MTEHIILLHGLWMRGFALSMLHHRLMEAGFRVHRFDYLSVAASQQHILDRLHQRIATLAGEADAVHLVGHSLGGLLALRACSDGKALPPGRIVCLGSPLRGSAAARGFAGCVLLNVDLLDADLPNDALSCCAAERAVCLATMPPRDNRSENNMKPAKTPGHEQVAEADRGEERE